jgi:hypothetical protein
MDASEHNSPRDLGFSYNPSCCYQLVAMDAHLQQAEKLKKDGNAAYAAGRFQVAAKLYQRVSPNITLSTYAS